jgi:hypothetical protein
MARTENNRHAIPALMAAGALALLVSLVPVAMASARPSKEKVVFADDFSHETWNVGSYPNAEVTYDHGGLRMSLEAPGSIVFSSGPVPRHYGSIVVETDFTTDTTAYPIVHCMGSGLNSDYGGPHYELTLRSDVIGIAKFASAGADSVVIAGGPESAPPGVYKPAGQANRVRFECIDNAGAVDFRVVLNDKVVLEGSDTDQPLGGGGVGIAAVSRDAPGSVLFDNFELRVPRGSTVPEPLVGTSVADPDGPVLYQDDLKVAKPDVGFQPLTLEDTRGAARAIFAHGSYQVSPTAGHFFSYTADSVDIAVKNGTASARTDVEVTTSKRSGGKADYGVVCNQGPGVQTAYYLGIDDDGFAAIVESQDGAFRPLATTSAPVADVKKASGTNVVRGTCDTTAEGAHLRLAVNGLAVLEVTDTAPIPPGSVGVYVESLGGPASTVRFQNFTARG